MFCPTCGKDLPDNARFCPVCGGNTDPTIAMGSTPSVTGSTPGVAMNTAVMEIPLEQQAPVAAAAAASPAPKMDNRKKGLLAGLGAALAVALIAIAVVSFAGPANAAVDIDEENFPDQNFRAYVADNFDKDGDGKLSDEELDSVTTINIDGSAKADAERVSDLTGIGHFRSLRTLNAPYNRLHGIPRDFRHLHNVRVVNITNNYITEDLDFTENNNIEVIYVPVDVDVTVTTPSDTEVRQEEEVTYEDVVEENPEVADDENGTTEDPEGTETTDDNGESGTTEDGGESATTDNGENGESDDKSDGESGDKADGESTEGTDEKQDSTEAPAASKPASDSSTLFAFQQDGKWGYMDEKGTVVLEPQYADAGSYSENIAPVKSGSDFSFVKNTGEAANDVTGTSVLPYSEGFAYVQTGKAKDTPTATGSMVSGTVLEAPGKFVKADGSELKVSGGLTGGGEFHDGYAPAKTSAGWGFIDTKGNWTVAAGYDQVTSAASVNGTVIAGVCTSGTWTYINVENGQQAFEGEFTEASAFDSTGHAVVKHKAADTSTQTSGDIDEMPVATTARYMPGDAQFATVDEELDEDPDLLAEEDADAAAEAEAEAEAQRQAEEEAAAEAEAQRQAEEEAAAAAAAEEEAKKQAEEEEAKKKAEEEAKKKAEEEANKVVTDKYVVIDATGNDTGVIEDFNTVSAFYDGYAAVKNSDGKCGFIGVDGKKIIECNFKEVGHFDGKYASAANDKGKWGVIDTNGNWVVEAKYDGMRSVGAL